MNYSNMTNVDVGNYVECITLHQKKTKGLTVGKKYLVIKACKYDGSILRHEKGLSYRFSIRDNNNKERSYQVKNTQFMLCKNEVKKTGHKMIPVVINEWETDTEFKTEMPLLPSKGDLVGMWIDDDWHLCEVHCIVHKFEENGEFRVTEVNVSTSEGQISK